eukprot:GSMAST32.ASY1.ANO1.1650.1 assembled CDS
MLLALLCGVIALQFAAVSKFSFTFFDVSNTNQMPQPVGHLDNQNNSNSETSMEAVYDRVVIMLVDALRSDFAFEGNMPYAQTPTVTLPRLKALATGSTPKFIDVIHNFNAEDISDNGHDDKAANSEYSLLDRLRTAGKKLVMYGDDTWLKLFPNRFLRADGTVSFFTNDFTEVDNNVTRHLIDELDPTWIHSKSQDWDVLLLHYLGLDHIGHV